MDPGAFAVGAPDMAQLLARSRVPVTLARGEHDAMNTSEQLARLGVPVVTLTGPGHNAHVESPGLSITLLDPLSMTPGAEQRPAEICVVFMHRKRPHLPNRGQCPNAYSCVA
jgi:hypothetical protein